MFFFNIYTHTQTHIKLGVIQLRKGDKYIFMGLAVVEMYMAFVGWEVFKTEVNGQGRGLSQRNQDMYP